MSEHSNEFFSGETLDDRHASFPTWGTDRFAFELGNSTFKDWAAAVYFAGPSIKID